MEERTTDLAVVGGGPCGLAVAAAATRLDLRSVVFDRGPLCASIVGYPPYLTFFSTPEKLEVEGLPFVTSGTNPTRKEALAYYRGVAGYFSVDVRTYQEVRSVTPREQGFELQTEKQDGQPEEWIARAVVIATGGFGEPNRLNVPGEDLPKVSHYYREAHPYWDQDVVVVGAGNSAVEAALELFRVGARVTVVHFADDFDSGVKAWILPDIRNRVEQEEIAVRWRNRVTEILPRSVRVRSEDTGAEEEILNDWVLALTGWSADSALLRSVGVSVDPDSGVPDHDPSTMETSVPGLFVAGVLVAGKDANKVFIENGRLHGRRIVDRVLSLR
jgi:thioredoxin reductase (NADPH)